MPGGMCMTRVTHKCCLSGGRVHYLRRRSCEARVPVTQASRVIAHLQMKPVVPAQPTQREG
eukprot:2290390-Pyramimonas_sp.AAC.1